MAEYLIQDTTLDAIADAINAKTGGSSAMTPSQMAAAIGNIPSGGGGYTLLASGTYTVASTTSIIDIPTGFTGAAKIVMVVKNDIDDSTDQMHSWAILYSYIPVELANVYGEYRLWKYRSSGYVTVGKTNYGSIDLRSNGTIHLVRYGPGCDISAGDYSWYIWG